MKKFIAAIALTAILFGCNHDKTDGKFTISGDIKNLPDQKIYLEELYKSYRDSSEFYQ